MVGCLVRLQEAKGTLAQAEERIRIYILSDPKAAANLTISELADSCATSRTTVVRLCRALGYSGYKEFSKALLRDTASEALGAMYADIHSEDCLGRIVESVSLNNISSIQHTLSMISHENLARAVDAIITAGRLHFYGVGGSGIVAKDAQYKFLRIFRDCAAFTDPHEQRFAAASLGKGDVAVLVSYTGQTPDMLETFKVLRQTGATTIAITRYGRNPISDGVDIPLCVSSAETALRSGATGSRIAQLNVVDILYTAVSGRTYSQIKERLALTQASLGSPRSEGLI